jgi:hypothetical protein
MGMEYVVDNGGKRIYKQAIASVRFDGSSVVIRDWSGDDSFIEADEVGAGTIMDSIGTLQE